MTAKRARKGNRRPRSAVPKIIREALRHETMTPEGIVNIATVALIVVALIAGPLLSGATAQFEMNGDKGWSVKVSMGDMAGGVVGLVITVLVCLLIVGGTNYLRERGRR